MSNQTHAVHPPMTNEKNDQATISYSAIAKKMLSQKGVTESKMFGGPVLKTHGKVFAFPYRNDFVFKLPGEIIEKLVAEKKGSYFDPGHGRPSKAWVAVHPVAHRRWSLLAEKAKAFVDETR